ncbi:ABC transporter substrate-binding protein, partial [Rhizobium ruizarguesonis]
MLRQVLTTIAITGAMMTAQPSFAASPPNMLVIGTNLTGIRTLDPAQNNARTVSELISNIYDNLVQLSPDDLKTLKP